VTRRPRGRPDPVPAPAYPWTGPTPYPQLLRTPTYAAWRSLVGTVTVLFWFVAGGTVLLPLLLLFVAVQARIEGTAMPSLAEVAKLDPLTPASLLWLNCVLAALTLVAFALVRWLHHLRPRWLTSVRPGLRTRFFLACVPIAVIAMVVQVLLAAVLPTGDSGAGSADPGGSPNHLGWQALAFALVILVSTPLQAMGEEYVFRGYLMQAIGSLFPRWSTVAVWATLVGTSLLFALAHGSQNVPLFLDRFAFGMLASYLVLRVGGLEAGIALHVMNNFFAFGLALVSGDITTILKVSEASYWNLPVTVVQSVLYLVLVLAVAKRMGVTNRTSGPATNATSAPGLTIGGGSA
jgi:membrane protease YdiL (CAAX protease family)